MRLVIPALPRAYAVEMEDVEARSRLSSVLDVCEYEMLALHDARLSGVLQAMAMLRAEVVAALATLTPDANNGGEFYSDEGVRRAGRVG